MTTSSLGCLQLSCAVYIWALLQWQPCLCLDKHLIDLDPNHHLQTWSCRFILSPASSQGTCLAIYTLGWPWALVTRPTWHPSCPRWGVHLLLLKSLLLACLVMTPRLQTVISSAFAAPLHAAAKLHLSPHSVSMFFATKPGNTDLDKNHKRWSKILQKLRMSQCLPLHLREC